MTIFSRIISKNSIVQVGFLVAFLAILLFFRLYNLGNTARFTYDESSDLARMYQIVSEGDITLVGPISTDNKKVFSSLSYYMVLPFVFIGDFSPISPVYGAVFWGVLTSLMLVYMVWKYNPKYWMWMAGLSVIWYPLLLSSRWAWNPHYMVFWIALGLVLYFKKHKYAWFVSGICMGFAFHAHYISIVSTGLFILLVSLEQLYRKRFKLISFMWLGFGFSLLPFLIYDLLKPPGLFFGKYLVSGSDSYLFILNADSLLQNLTRGIRVFAEVSVFYSTLLPVFLILILALFMGDLIHKNLKALVWTIPVIGQLGIGLVMTDYLDRYFFPAIPFLLLWMISKRKGRIHFVSYALFVVMIVGSIFSLRQVLYENTFPPSVVEVAQISNALEKIVVENDLNNVNVAALSSHDREPLAYKYREVMKTKDINFRQINEYDVSEHLLVITTSNLEDLLLDESYAMLAFENVAVSDVVEIEGTEWKIYWFNKLLPRINQDT